MTFDGTNVDVDELRRFGRDAHSRADDTTSAADAVAGVHMGNGMLGVFSNFFLDDANRHQHEALSGIRSTAAMLADDGDIATTNADRFDDTNAEQASRFTNEELP